MDIREATAADADAIGRMLHDFNLEYEEETPGAAWIAERIRSLGDTTVLLCGPGPDGLAVLRFRPFLWTDGLECYLAELYVKPELRGQGRGRALMDAVLETARKRGADYIELNTDEEDTAAHALYASVGLTHTARYYELDLRG